MLTVIALIGLMIGWRAALVVALAVPVCYSVTLFVNLLSGYTINRVTLFALILSLGLVVDDPITDVENIARYFAHADPAAAPAVLTAVQEVRPALILSTLAIIVSFLPLFFITGMMGPYMAADGAERAADGARLDVGRLRHHALAGDGGPARS